MLKQFIFAVLTGLLHRHLVYINNHHEYLSCFMQLYNRMTESSSFSRDSLNLSEHQAHSHWNQTVMFSVKHQPNRYLHLREKWTPTLSISHTTVTLNEGKGHPN